MKKSFLLVLLACSLVFLFYGQNFAQVNEYLLDPVDLQISPWDSTVQVNVNVRTVDPRIELLVVPLIAEGTCLPVLDTVLTGGLMSAIQPAFYPPSLAAGFTLTVVNPYGPPTVPMVFYAFDTGGGILNPTEGLFCRMFYRVSGPGTLTFRTAIHPVAGPVLMSNPTGPLPINWPAEGTVDSFELTEDTKQGDANYDGTLSVGDVVYLINYLFKAGPSQHLFKGGDLNCDGMITIADVIYLVNYLYKGGPSSPC